MKILENFPLQQYNTFGIKVSASFFSSFSTAAELEEGAAFLQSGRRRPRPLLVLGGGSNLLFTDNFDGLVLKNEIRGIQLVHEDHEYVYVKVGAGENWHGFVQYALGRNWAGLENLSLIPGSVGAAPMQNIGAYGVEVKEVFHELEAWHIGDRKVRTFSLNDCAFGYRESVFKRKYKGQFIILYVSFRLRKAPVFHTEYGAIREELERMGVQDLSIRAISQAVINIRRSKLPDPARIGNAGSFFKNPTVAPERWEALKAAHPGIIGYPQGKDIKLAAGWLIEQCGWKGYRKGDAGCHDRQALVLVNYGNATGKEIYGLSEEIVRSVTGKFGVTLEREVNIV